MFSLMKPYLKALVGQYLKDDSGQTIIEYVMLIVLIALAVFLMSPSITSAVVQVFSQTSSALGWRPTT